MLDLIGTDTLPMNTRITRSQQYIRRFHELQDHHEPMALPLAAAYMQLPSACERL